MYKYPVIGVPTDYSDANNWFMCPDKNEMVHDADYIYFNGTTATTSVEGGICSVDDPTLRAPEKIAQSLGPEIFAPMCNLFYPWWRQVTASAIFRLSEEEVAKLEYAEPRTDVFAALDYYFEHYNNGKPFIIAGHSQGARMVSLILEDYMLVHPDRYKRMIAAYQIGDGLTEKYLNENPHVKAAQGADDIGVCISWNTEGPANENHYGLIVKPGCVCINPLNWKTDETYASAEANIGCLIVDNEIKKAIPIRELADARINLKRGTVVVDSKVCKKYVIRGEQVKSIFGPESYHNCDYGFFYYNIRENAKLRIRRWFEINPK